MLAMYRDWNQLHALCIIIASSVSVARLASASVECGVDEQRSSLPFLIFFVRGFFVVSTVRPFITGSVWQHLLIDVSNEDN
jgi:hypothetical protein